MKILVVLFVFCFFLAPFPPVKCAMRDTFNCFVRRGQCKFYCHSTERKIGLCSKVKATCCIEV
uniref:Defensin beta 133 n=1 Tax=Molossus molossus TaxID=27622 RepID=A0A7J8GPZ9_MOLMO|nr:defensin beta 133 [Molossus molossus]